jgi:HEAT repeat protein
VTDVLVAVILALAIVFFGLTAVIVAGKARREAREARERELRRTLEPRILAYAQEERGSIHAALGRAPTPAGLRVVEQVLLDHAQCVRGAALERLTRAFEDLGLVERYRRALGSARPWRRAWGAENLGLAGARHAAPDLARALEDRTVDVRMRAAKALGLLGEARSSRSLVAALDVPSRWSSIRVADVLATIGPDAVAEVIAAHAELGPAGRIAAIDVIGRARPLHAVPWLLARLDDAEPDERSRAAHALGAIGDASAVPALEAALRDRAWAVRAMAAKALGRIGDPAAIPGLRRALRDREWWVRSNAARALGALGQPGLEALEATLDSSDRFARAQAIHVLEERGVVEERARGLVADDSTERRLARTFVERLVTAGGTARLSELALGATSPGLRESLREQLVPR